MRTRKLISTNALEETQKLLAQGVPITLIVKLLELNIHYRTAFDIIRADTKGYHQATRPSWLQENPAIQESPEGWYLVDGFTVTGHWASV